MADKKISKSNHRKRFTENVDKKELRKMRAREQKPESFWYGLGVIGFIGWSVVIPTLIGVAVGLWLDGRYPGTISWTLTLMFVGLGLGSFNAWYWISSERKKIEEQRRRGREEGDEKEEKGEGHD